MQVWIVVMADEIVVLPDASVVAGSRPCSPIISRMLTVVMPVATGSSVQAADFAVLHSSKGKKAPCRHESGDLLQS